MIETREMALAMPSVGADIYRAHQLVWSAVAEHTRGRNAFVFAFEHANVVRVRSLDLPERYVRAIPAQGVGVIDLVAVEGHAQTRPIAASRLPQWLSAQLATNGIAIEAIDALDMRVVEGRKYERALQRTHVIRQPVAHAQVRYTITDEGRARRALHAGIGRGRRFGFGMLRCMH